MTYDWALSALHDHPYTVRTEATVVVRNIATSCAAASGGP